MVGQYMTDPLEVKVNQSATVNQNIDHQFALVRHSDKSEAIARFLDLDPDLYGVVFCRTRRDTQALAEDLLKRGYRADALHGEMSQAQRDRVMLRFKQKHLQVLVATDVAARGIDVDNLTHVFHHSLPGKLPTTPTGPAARPAPQEGHFIGARGERAWAHTTGCRGRWTSSSPRPWCRTLKRSSTPGSPRGARACWICRSVGAFLRRFGSRCRSCLANSPRRSCFVRSC